MSATIVANKRSRLTATYMASNVTAEAGRIRNDGEEGSHEGCESDGTLSEDRLIQSVSLVEHTHTTMEPNEESPKQSTEHTE